MKYYKVTADYRPRSESSPIYVCGVQDDTSPRQMRKLFKAAYPWLDVYEAEEIYGPAPFTLYFGENESVRGEFLKTF